MKQAMIRPSHLLYSMIGILYALILLLINLANPIVYLVWVFSLMIVVVRLRFKKLSEGIVIDFILYSILIYTLDASILYMVLPSILLSVYHQKFYFILIGYGLWLLIDSSNPNALFIITLSTAISILLYIYKTVTLTNQKALDHLRHMTYQLESEQVTLLEAQSEISRLSTLEERDRIAQTLHDDLGHELTGALIALRAFKTTHSDLIDDQSLNAVNTRLENAVGSLKNTVAHATVNQAYGIDAFTHHLNNALSVPVEFNKQGPLISLTATHWQVFTSVLKEGLTNIQKHAKATQVIVNLSVDRKVVTLSIKNNGVNPSENQKGKGLYYMRKRLEALQGTLSIQKDYYFTLRCTVPITLVKDDNK